MKKKKKKISASLLVYSLVCVCVLARAQALFSSLSLHGKELSSNKQEEKSFKISPPLVFGTTPLLGALQEAPATNEL